MALGRPRWLGSQTHLGESRLPLARDRDGRPALATTAGAANLRSRNGQDHTTLRVGATSPDVHWRLSVTIST